MPYNFDELTERLGTGSVKWDVLDGELPMWVADMDFKTAPEITESLMKRAAHGIFGYTVVPDAWREAITGWWERRHGFVMEKEWLVFATGVVPAISSTVRKLTTVGEMCWSRHRSITFSSILYETIDVISSKTGCSMMDRTTGLTGKT